MAWIAAAAIGSALLSADAQSSAAGSASDASSAQTGAQTAWNKQQDPFSSGGNRAQYVPQMNELMRGGVAGVANDPMYQAMNAQSMQDVQRSMSARGQGGSGQEMLALRNSSQGNMMNYFNQQYNRLGELSGATKGGGSSPAQFMQSPGSVYQQGADRGQALGNIFGAGMGAMSNRNNSNTTNSNWTAEDYANQPGSLIINGQP